MTGRRPSVAGAFYAGTASSLKAQIEEGFLHKFGPGKTPRIDEKGPRRVLALVSPHAGYRYSGPVAANGFFRLAQDSPPNIVVILGPNHTGVGSGVSVVAEGSWETPLGEVSMASDVAQKIQESSQIVDVDEAAHRHEHSIEVQLPFLQFLYGSKFRLVPICMMMQDLRTSVEVGEAVAIGVEGKEAVVVASSDMTHYEAQSAAVKKDRKAIDAILELNEEELQRVVDSEMISMCGYGPVTAGIACAKKLGAKRAELLSYKTSGDVTGDKGAVVGYASIAIMR